jgi:hypothetical protein
MKRWGQGRGGALGAATLCRARGEAPLPAGDREAAARPEEVQGAHHLAREVAEPPPPLGPGRARAAVVAAAAAAGGGLGLRLAGVGGRRARGRRRRGQRIGLKAGPLPVRVTGRVGAATGESAKGAQGGAACPGGEEWRHGARRRRRGAAARARRAAACPTAAAACDGASPTSRSKGPARTVGALLPLLGPRLPHCGLADDRAPRGSGLRRPVGLTDVPSCRRAQARRRAHASEIIAATQLSALLLGARIMLASMSFDMGRDLEAMEVEPRSVLTVGDRGEGAPMVR